MTMKRNNSAACIANYWQRKSVGSIPWQICWKPVCASTEIDLSRWIDQKPLRGKTPRAVISDRQTHGKGQRGRFWQSPEGGIWISAAFPCLGKKQSVGLFGLAVAFALVERLETKKISAQIKWPNDLLVQGKKLAGILPSVISRGQSNRVARVGIGLNVANKTPPQGISIAEILNYRECDRTLWAGEVLLALDRAKYFFEQEESFYLKAQERLWSEKVVDPKTGEIWEIDGLDISGGLKLHKDGKKTIWIRWG